jgi:hypothetical protein
MKFCIITLFLIKDLCCRSLIVSMIIIIKNHAYDLNRKHFFHKQQICKTLYTGYAKKKWIFVIRKCIVLKMTPLGVILRWKSIARIPKPWKCFPDSGKNCVFEAKMVIFRIFKNPIFPWIRSGKHFQGSGMRTIDFSYKITLET